MTKRADLHGSQRAALMCRIGSDVQAAFGMDYDGYTVVNGIVHEAIDVFCRTLGSDLPFRWRDDPAVQAALARLASAPTDASS